MTPRDAPTSFPSPGRKAVSTIIKIFSSPVIYPPLAQSPPPGFLSGNQRPYLHPHHLAQSSLQIHRNSYRPYRRTSGFLFKIRSVLQSVRRKSLSCLISFGTLDCYKLCLFIDCFFIVIVKCTAFQKIYLAIGNSVLRKRTIWAGLLPMCHKVFRLR